MLGKGRRPKEKGMTEDVMVRQHHQLNGHDSEQTPEDGGGQRSRCAAVYGVEKSQT